MKILAISSSPRRDGNSELLFKEFVKGAREGGAEVDEIYLNKLNIKPCLEIYACEKNGRCCIKDDYDAIYDKLEQCDKLLIAMPIFFYAMPAQLKALIDRCQAFYVRKYTLKQPILPADAPRREAYLIALGGCKAKNLFDATFDILDYFYDSLDMELKESLLYRQIDKKGDVLQHPTALQEAYELGVKAATTSSYHS